MSRSNLAAGIRQLRSKLAQQCRHEESDEQLLQAFTSRRDEAAFVVLVRRHGPMVLHVCRRVLDHEQDAEDAFQAVFLLLAQSAAGLRNKTALAGFLHGAAYRIALTAKRSAARRRKHEGSLGALTPPHSPLDPAEELSWREVRTLLDEEIARLPEKYRTVFVLCYLENLSQAEAARRLGLKERTLSSQLTAARKRLGQRLARRGVELTAVSPALWAFLVCAGVEPTNNHAERVLRPAVLWRRRSFGCQSAAGCRFVERLLTVVQSLRLQQRPVLAFLHETLGAHRSGASTPRLVVDG